MAGKGSSLKRLLAAAQQGPTQKGSAAASPSQQEPARRGQAEVGAASEDTRSRSKKRRPTGGEADRVVGEPDHSDQMRHSVPGNELQPRVGPSWLDHLSEDAHGNPYLACQELVHAFSSWATKAQADGREKDKLVKELESALKASNEKTMSTNKELKSTKEELKAEKGKRKSLEEELKLAEEKVKDLTGWREGLEEEKESLSSQLAQAQRDGNVAIEESFENAIQQVEFCHPELIDRRIVDHRHEVLGDRIQCAVWMGQAK